MTTKLVLEFIARRQVRALFRIYPGFCRAVDSVALRCRQRLKSAASRCRRQISCPEEAAPARPASTTGRRRSRNGRRPRRGSTRRCRRRSEHCQARKEAAERRLEDDLRSLDREHERRLTESAARRTTPRWRS